jgi:hypothetical protein
MDLNRHGYYPQKSIPQDFLDTLDSRTRVRVKESFIKHPPHPNIIVSIAWNVAQTLFMDRNITLATSYLSKYTNNIKGRYLVSLELLDVFFVLTRLYLDPKNIVKCVLSNGTRGIKMHVDILQLSVNSTTVESVQFCGVLKKIVWKVSASKFDDMKDIWTKLNNNKTVCAELTRLGISSSYRIYEYDTYRYLDKDTKISSPPIRAALEFKNDIWIESMFPGTNLNNNVMMTRVQLISYYTGYLTGQFVFSQLSSTGRTFWYYCCDTGKYVNTSTNERINWETPPTGLFADNPQEIS